MSVPPSSAAAPPDSIAPAGSSPQNFAEAHLALLGYRATFRREMSLWANISLGFTYLSPLVGVYSLFGYGLSLAGPPAIWWLLIVGTGQFLVCLVFGEVVSQYPVSGGIYQWVRRLWNRQSAWLVTWVYALAMIVTVTSIAEFGGAFASPLFGIESSNATNFAVAVALLLLALVLNFSGTRNMARVAQIGLAGELIGVVALGLYLLIFKRKNDISVVFDNMGALSTHPNYTLAFLSAALTGLFLFYGFEACGSVAEEVTDPGRRIPHAMRLTIFIGGASAMLSFLGYLLAAPDLQGIVDGKVADPIASILQSTLGSTGEKVFLVIAMVSFVSCVLSLQASASRLLYSFARDNMVPASHWLGHVSEKHQVPTRALTVVCVLPILLCAWVYVSPDALAQITAFATLGIYVAFQTVVFAALRNRLTGWRPAGEFSLGRWGLLVNIAALAYGVTAIGLLVWPRTELDGINRYLPLIGLVAVLAVGEMYRRFAHPENNSTGPEGDAKEFAHKLRELHAQYDGRR